MAGDKITEAVRILAALVGVAQNPTLLSALKAGPVLRDSLKKIAASPPASFARLAEDLGQSGATVFASLREKPRDAEVLYLQMVEAGLPHPARIMADRMDAAAVTEGMLAGLTEREHRDPAMQALFRALTQPALERLLADKAFAADLTPAFMRAVLESLAETQRLLEEMRRSYGTLSAALEDRRRQSRTQLEAMALRFGELEPERLSDADLETFLNGKAKDLRAAQAQLGALSDQGGQIAKLKAAAGEAMADLRLVEARDLIRDALSVQRSERTLRVLREDADLVEVEAQIALLKNDADEAARLLENAARSFVPFDWQKAFDRRHNAVVTLYEHGLRYGGSGLARAVELGRSNIVTAEKMQNSICFGVAQTCRGVALRAQGARLGGPEGAALLGEAIAGYEAALRVQTEAAHPMDWAVTQNNLGIALQAQGELLDGLELTDLLDRAVAAYEAALRVWSEATHPVDWATSQNNLGNVRLAQGTRLGEAEGAALLGEAVTAYRAALRVRTEAAHPVGWAMTTENLGVVKESFADNATCADPKAALDAAANCFTDALRIFDPETMPYDHARATASLARVRAKLAALPDPA